MKKEKNFFNTLQEQYQFLGWPTELIGENTDFTIFNLASLNVSFPFGSPVSRLNFFVFGFIKKAKGHYIIDDQRFEIQQRTIYFTNPGHYRSFQYTSIDEAHLITLSEDFLKENVQKDIYEEFPFLLAETFPATVVSQDIFNEFERIYLQILKEYHSQSPFRLRVLGSLFIVLLLKFKEYFWLSYNSIYEGNRNSQIVRNFKRMLEKHYRELADGKSDRVFRLQDYGEALNLHPNYLSTVIKNKTGKAIGTWIAEKNIAESKSLLQNSLMPIKEIVYRLDFTDAAHFSKYFKKYTNCSPTEYRRKHSIIIS